MQAPPRPGITARAVLAVVISAGAAAGPVPAAAATGDPPLVHLIYTQIPDAPQNDLALKQFSAGARRFGLGPVEVVDIEGSPPPKAAAALGAAIPLVRKLEFGPGLAALDEAAAEVAASGGAGLDPASLSDLYLYRAWAVSRADFNPDRAPAPAARTQAYGDLVRAAMLAPGRALNTQQFPPALLEDWARAVADARARAQTLLRVRATPEALVSVDGGTPIPGPASFAGLAQGEHLVRVEEPGWAPWGGTIQAQGAEMTLEVPSRRSLTLEDAGAAARARRMGARFALVAEPRTGGGGLTLALRLVDAATGERRDAALVPLAGDVGALEAAVMRLDEQARRIGRSGGEPAAGVPPAAAPDAPPPPPPVLVAEPPPRPRLADDPGGWARDHWPLLTAVGVTVAAAIAFGLAVGRD